MTLSAEQEALLPKSKHDIESVSRLSALPPEVIVPLVPDLLDWLQDVNWPVARPIFALVLKKCPQAAIAPIRNILFPGPEIEPDHEWQHNVLGHLVFEMPRAQKEELRSDLERFHAGVSDAVEKDWALREYVEETLASLDDEAGVK